jgi:hypothetical protein
MSSYLIGEKSVWQKSHGMLAACGEYISGPEGREPAMVIFPMGKLTDPAICPAAICLSALYQWLDPKYATRTAQRMVTAMGLEDSPGMITKFLDVVYHHIDDVVSMPPENKTETNAERQVVAELSFTSDGVTREREILAGETGDMLEIVGG